MTPRVVLTERVEGGFVRKSKSATLEAPARPCVLIATADPETRDAMRELLKSTGVNAIWVSGVNEVRTVVAKEQIAACLCGFWLQDGTYREVIRYLRRAAVNVPAIIVAAPACPQEYREYLSAVNLGALDFLCYPYRQSDLASMLEAAIGSRLIGATPQDVAASVDYRDRGAA